MKSLKTLIKLSSFHLEEQRLVLKALYEKRDGFTNRIDKIQKDLVDAKAKYKEQAGQESDFVFTGTIHVFIQKSLGRINDLNTAVAFLDKDIEKEQDKLKELFAEVKKFELTEESRLKADKEAKEKKEQQILDELSNQKYVFDKR